MAAEISNQSVDELIAHYLKYNDVNGAKFKSGVASRSASVEKAVVAEKKANPVALPGTNPKYDATIHCVNCQTRKFKKDCKFKCCYNCCVYSEATSSKRTECDIHSAEYEKKLAEERYIEEAMDYEYGGCKDASDPNSRGSLYYKKKKLKQFVHAEDRFSDVNQTVVVWCLHDFGMFKKYSEDCFALDVRLKRQEDVRRRREATGTGVGSGSGSGSSTDIVKAIRQSKLSRKQKFDTWHARVIQNRK